MLHEYRDLITELKGKNAHFDAVFNKHNDLDQRILNVEEGREHMDQFELETLKKEKEKEFMISESGVLLCKRRRSMASLIGGI